MAAQEGISLPLKTTEQDENAASRNSLNKAAATVSEEAILESLWSKVVLRLRRHYFDCLQKLPISAQSSLLDETCSQRLKHLQTLCCFLPEKDVWSKYQQLRVMQFSAISVQRQLALSKNRSLPATFESLSSEFANTVDSALAMMLEDFRILNANVFASHVTVEVALREIYLEQVDDDVNFLLEKFENELSEVQPQRASVANGTKKQSRASTKRTSLRHRDSRSPDSTLSNTLEHGFTDLQTLPADAIQRHSSAMVK